MQKGEWKHSKKFTQLFATITADDLDVDILQKIKDLNLHPVERKWLLERVYVLAYERYFQNCIDGVKPSIDESVYILPHIKEGNILDINSVRNTINNFING